MQPNSRSLNDDFKAVQARRVALDGRKTLIEQAQAKLNAARRAAPLKTLIDAIARLGSDREKAAEKAERAVADRDDAEAALSVAEAEARSARERQEREEPLLIERKTKLETALSEKAKLDDLTGKRGQLVKVVGEVEQEIRKAEQVVAALESDLKTLAAKIESLEREQQGLTVDSELRDSVDIAAALLAPLESAERERIKSQGDLDRKRILSDKARRKVLDVFARLSQIAASRYLLSDTGALVETTPAIPSMNDAISGEEFVSAADREIDVAGSLIVQASEMERQALIHEKASVLAAELEEGKPCPVCGSLEHPKPAVGSTGFSDRTRQSREVLQACLEKLHSWKTELQASIRDWDNAKQNEFQAADAVSNRESELEQTLGEFREAAKQALGESYAEDTARSLIAKTKQQIAEKDRERPRVERELTGARQKESATRVQLEDANKTLSSLRNQHSAKSSELAMLNEQVKDLEATVRDMTGGVDPSQGIASIESSVKSLRESAKNAVAQEEAVRKRLTECIEQATSAESTLARVCRIWLCGRSHSFMVARSVDERTREEHKRVQQRILGGKRSVTSPDQTDRRSPVL